MAETVIQTQDLVKDHFSDFLRKRVRVIDHLNLKILCGDSYGLLGPNGAGKTTTIKLLLGLSHPTSGFISVLKKPAGNKKALANIGFLPENPYLYSHLTGYEFLDFSGKLFALSAFERQKRSKELLTKVSLAYAANLPIRKYSKGMVQRLGIAQALINDPDLVFLDEPLSGLDPIGRREVKQILIDLRKAGKTIFLSSHLLPDVSEICNQVGVLYQGKLAGETFINQISCDGDYRNLEKYFFDTINNFKNTSGSTLAPEGVP